MKQRFRLVFFTSIALITLLFAFSFAAMATEELADVVENDSN